MLKVLVSIVRDKAHGEWLSLTSGTGEKLAVFEKLTLHSASLMSNLLSQTLSGASMSITPSNSLTSWGQNLRKCSAGMKRCSAAFM